MIELLVAVALFAIVVSIASGTFVQALRTQRQMVALMAANDNASLALEQMVREIRTGREFSTTGTRLTFTNYLEQTVTYELESAEIGTIIRASNAINQPLTSKNVDVKYLNFDLVGEDLNDGQSTRVRINLGVNARGLPEGFATSLQTSVSSRILDS